MCTLHAFIYALQIQGCLKSPRQTYLMVINIWNGPQINIFWVLINKFFLNVEIRLVCSWQLRMDPRGLDYKNWSPVTVIRPMKTLLTVKCSILSPKFIFLGPKNIFYWDPKNVLLGPSSGVLHIISVRLIVESL